MGKKSFEVLNCLNVAEGRLFSNGHFGRIKPIRPKLIEKMAVLHYLDFLNPGSVSMA